MDVAGRISQEEYHAALDRRDARESAYRHRIVELEAALRSLVEMEVNRYACGTHWRQTFDEARRVLANQK